ncbi:MAG: hypothetical protein ACI8RN_003115, partial [Glaciecola sp.]
MALLLTPTLAVAQGSMPFSLEYLREPAAQWGLLIEEVASNSYLLWEATI